MKLTELFLTKDPTTMFATDLWDEINEHIEDLIPFARAAAPSVIDGHEDRPLLDQLTAAIMAGIAVGWAARKELDD